MDIHGVALWLSSRAKYRRMRKIRLPTKCGFEIHIYLRYPEISHHSMKGGFKYLVDREILESNIIELKFKLKLHEETIHQVLPQCQVQEVKSEMRLQF